MRDFNSDYVPKPVLSDFVKAAFDRTPLDIEIGAGQGLHAIRYCQSHPDRTLIAVERTHAKFQALRHRALAHPQLTGLFPLQADAVSVFTHFVKDSSVENIFLLYPNPYPKHRQANLRWHNSPFTRRLCKKLKSGGRLVVATNVNDYAEEAQDRFRSIWNLNLESVTDIGTDDLPRTHFEKKYLERGERCWNLVFSKP